MNLKRKCQVVMLSTNEKANIQLTNNVLKYTNKLFASNVYNTQGFKNPNKNQHLYILSDEKIEEGWEGIAYKKDVEGLIFNHFYTENPWYNDAKKVIASTDKSLNLPEPSPEFIQKYIETYNSGNLIKEVMVEYVYKNKITFGNCIYKEINGDGSYYELINGEVEKTLSIKELESYGIIMYEPKVNKSNQISITKVKDSWSREEVSDLILKIVKEISYGNDYLLEHYSGDFKDAKKWISENL